MPSLSFLRRLKSQGQFYRNPVAGYSYKRQADSLVQSATDVPLCPAPASLRTLPRTLFPLRNTKGPCNRSVVVSPTTHRYR